MRAARSPSDGALTVSAMPLSPSLSRGDGSARPGPAERRKEARDGPREASPDSVLNDSFERSDDPEPRLEAAGASADAEPDEEVRARRPPVPRASRIVFSPPPPPLLLRTSPLTVVVLPPPPGAHGRGRRGERDGRGRRRGRRRGRLARRRLLRAVPADFALPLLLLPPPRRARPRHPPARVSPRRLHVGRPRVAPRRAVSPHVLRPDRAERVAA